MKKTSLSLALAASLLGAAGAASAAETPASISPFTFAGRVVDYRHVAYDADSSVEIRLKDAAGALLARTTTATSGQTVYNYVLVVPVSTTPASRYACVGDAVAFEFVDPQGSVYTGLVASADAVIGNPGTVRRLDVVLATDADGDGIADQYLKDVKFLMWQAGIEGDYDPRADYDGDGRTNYEEYLAGTNPCDASDAFTVRQMAQEKGVEDYVALTIAVREGRAYGVVTSDSLASGAVWSRVPFSETADAEPSADYLVTGRTESGTRTIYVKKDGPRRFYKARIE